MIPAHKINLPSKIVIGHGVLTKIGELCEKLGFHNGKKSIFMVTGSTTLKIAGNTLLKTLEDEKYNVGFMEVKESNMGYVNWCQDEIYPGNVFSFPKQFNIVGIENMFNN